MKDKKQNPDVVETVMSREQMNDLLDVLDRGDDNEIEAFVEKRACEFLHDQAIKRMREILLREVILNVHHCLHTGEPVRAQNLLCVAASLVSGKEPPKPVMLAFITEMNAIATDRAIGDCEGSA